MIAWLQKIPQKKTFTLRRFYTCDPDHLNRKWSIANCSWIKHFSTSLSSLKKKGFRAQG